MVPLQVLVADDEPVSRTVVGAMLKKAGYPVIYASDGEQAWKMLAFIRSIYAGDPAKVNW